ncbi:MAG TPA: DUF262 domain-containing protein [Acidimicrobiales bacterium]|nr:DUF262 domain-containing protein [Acidimicrobiales bacterium]
MKAETVEILALFDRDVRYLIPIFQRNYKWNLNEHWGPLWSDVRNVAEDILDIGEGPDLGEHFLGAVVCEQKLSFGRDAQAVSVIDGQQRLMTLQLLLAGAHRVCAARGLADAEFLRGLIENKPVVVKDRPPHRFKVWPNVADRAGFQAALDEGPGTSRPEQAVRFFAELVDKWLEQGDLDDPLDDADNTPGERMDALVTALTRHLKLVKIDLEANDNAQVIFETLNARGERLTDADLIRNDLFRQADDEGLDVEKLHDQYWRPFDDDRWSVTIAHGRHQRERIHMFVNHWLSMRLLTEIPAAAIFRYFKDFVRHTGSKANEVAADLHGYGLVFDSFDRFPENSLEWWFFRRINEMDLITVYPVLLWLFGKVEQLPADNRRRALTAIESWLVRRLVGRDTTRGYGSLFVDLLKAAGSGPPADADARIVQLLASKSADVDRWPSDEAFRHTVLNTNVYKLKQTRLKMVLEAIEQKLCEGGRAEKIALGHNLWIEHLLPQTWSTVPEWALPPDVADPTAAAQHRDHLLHTLGNLTLTTSKLDIELSNRPWSEKVAQLRQSVLQLNATFGDNGAETWNEDTIRMRGNSLTDLMINIWPGPDQMLTQVTNRL